jgi:hypothetical protein
VSTISRNCVADQPELCRPSAGAEVSSIYRDFAQDGSCRRGEIVESSARDGEKSGRLGIP